MRSFACLIFGVIILVLGCVHTGITMLRSGPPCKTPIILEGEEAWISAYCDVWGDTLGHEEESLVMLTFQGDQLLAQYIWSHGSANRVMVSGLLLERAMRSGAGRVTSVVFLHNHPLFQPELRFSKNDLKAISQLDALARRNGIVLYDFVVVAPGRLLSARAQKYLDANTDLRI